MANSTTLQKARVRLAELVTIFLGVGLAFVAENWREGLADRRYERSTIAALQHDFDANVPARETLLSSEARLMNALGALRDTLQVTPDGASITLPDTLLMPLHGIAGTYSPRRGALDALIGAGRLDLISNDELRQALAAWPSEVATVAQTIEWETTTLWNFTDFGLSTGIPMDRLMVNYFAWMGGSLTPETAGFSVTFRNSPELRYYTQVRWNTAAASFGAISALDGAEASITRLLRLAD